MYHTEKLLRPVSTLCRALISSLRQCDEHKPMSNEILREFPNSNDCFALCVAEQDWCACKLAHVFILFIYFQNQLCQKSKFCVTLPLSEELKIV